MVMSEKDVVEVLSSWDLEHLGKIPGNKYSPIKVTNPTNESSIQETETTTRNNDEEPTVPTINDSPIPSTLSASNQEVSNAHHESNSHEVSTADTRLSEAPAVTTGISKDNKKKKKSKPVKNDCLNFRLVTRN